MSTTGAATTFEFEGAIRFHVKSRSGCLTCRKRRIKCDETKPICRRCYRQNLECVQRPKDEHNEQQPRPQETMLCKPLTAPTPIPMGIVSLQIMDHFTTVTCASFDSEPGCAAMLRTVLPQLSWYNPHLFHALLSFSALHLGRLHSEDPKWVYLASAHRKAAVAALPGATNLDAKFLTMELFIMYTISTPLSSSPENIFSLVTLLHNVLLTFDSRRRMYADQRLKAVDPFTMNLQPDLVEELGHLQQIYDFRMPGFELESEELLDPTISAAL